MIRPLIPLWLTIALGVGSGLGIVPPDLKTIPGQLGGNQPVIAGDLREIQERGYLIVGVKDNVPPLGFRNDQGVLQGLEINIARELAQEILGDRQAVQWKILKNQERLPAIFADQVDVVIARMGVTMPRRRVVEFSPHYYLDHTALITPYGTLQNLADFSGRRIAVLNYSSTIAIIQSALPAGQLVGVNSYGEAYEALQRGEVDAFAADYSVLVGWQQVHPPWSLHRVPGSGQALAVAMPRGLAYGSLRRAIDQAIATWRTNGWLADQWVRWGLEPATE